MNFKETIPFARLRFLCHCLASEIEKVVNTKQWNNGMVKSNHCH